MTTQDEQLIAICKMYAKICGYCPPMLGDVIRVLTHPDMLPLLQAYIAGKE